MHRAAGRDPRSNGYGVAENRAMFLSRVETYETWKNVSLFLPRVVYRWINYAVYGQALQDRNR